MAASSAMRISVASGSASGSETSRVAKVPSALNVCCPAGEAGISFPRARCSWRSAPGWPWSAPAPAWWPAASGWRARRWQAPPWSGRCWPAPAWSARTWPPRCRSPPGPTAPRRARGPRFPRGGLVRLRGADGEGGGLAGGRSGGRGHRDGLAVRLHWCGSREDRRDADRGQRAELGDSPGERAQAAQSLVPLAREVGTVARRVVITVSHAADLTSAIVKARPRTREGAVVFVG